MADKNKNAGAILAGAGIGFGLLLLLAMKNQGEPPLLVDVYGRVVDESTGDPLEGAKVTIGSRQALTNAAGSYIIEAILAGEYDIRFTKTGYESATIPVILTDGDNQINFAMVPVLVGGILLIPSNDTLVKELYPTGVIHYNRVNKRDSTYDPDAGSFGVFSGDFVHAAGVSFPSGWHDDIFELSAPYGKQIAGTIESVDIHVFGGRSGYPYGSIRGIIQTGDVIYTPEMLGGGISEHIQSYPLNPLTGRTWTPDEVNNLRAGVSINRGGTFSFVMCDYLFVEVKGDVWLV